MMYHERMFLDSYNRSSHIQMGRALFSFEMNSMLETEGGASDNII